MQYYDYNNVTKNQEVYGQETPPVISVEDITEVPIAMFSSKYDKIVNVVDNREYAGRIPAVLEHNEIEGDHLTFLLSKDMTWFQRVNELLDEYSPLQDELVNPDFVWLPEEPERTRFKEQREINLATDLIYDE